MVSMTSCGDLRWAVGICGGLRLPSINWVCVALRLMSFVGARAGVGAVCCLDDLRRFISLTGGLCALACHCYVSA